MAEGRQLLSRAMQLGASGPYAIQAAIAAVHAARATNSAEREHLIHRRNDLNRSS
jgi:predicted RNA polymerase sigma factor